MRQEIKDAIDRYAKDHVPTGGFLRAVLANDLMAAFGKADIHNRMDMFNICRYVYNEIPGDCHGSYAIVDAWIKAGKEAWDEKETMGDG